DLHAIGGHRNTAFYRLQDSKIDLHPGVVDTPERPAMHFILEVADNNRAANRGIAIAVIQLQPRRAIERDLALITLRIDLAVKVQVPLCGDDGGLAFLTESEKLGNCHVLSFEMQKPALGGFGGVMDYIDYKIYSAIAL